MKTLARYIRDRQALSKGFAYLVLFWGFIGVSLQTLRSLLGTNPFEYTLITHFYFTTQSNILIILVTLFYLFKKKRGHAFTSLAFIALVNICMTGIVFHIMLTPYMSGISFLNHVLHTINPLLYILFYFLVIDTHLATRKFWLSLIYPLCYMLAVYLLIEPIFGDLMEELMTTFVGARYVYPFLDPSTYEQGVRGLLLFNLGILAPSFALFSFILCYLKAQFEHYLKLIV